MSKSMSSIKNWDDIIIVRKQYTELINKLSNTQSDFFIFGARRVGKTTLLKFVEKELWKKKIPIFYFSIQGDMSSKKVKRRIESSFKRKKCKIANLSFKALSFFDFLDDIDSKLDVKLVFLIDEAEQIAEIEKKEPGFIDKLRNSVETLDNIQFFLTASPHFKRIIAKSKCSSFLSAFKLDILPVMTQEETTELIKKIVPNIENNEIDQILQFTHYQPYLVKIFISKLLRNGKLQSPSQEIAIDTYIANALDGIFPNYFDGLSFENQKIVRHIYSGDLKDIAKHERKLRELTQYGYLKFEGKKYKISNWFFEHWLSGEPDEKNLDVSKTEHLSEEVKTKQKDLSVWFFVLALVTLLLSFSFCAMLLKSPILVTVTFTFTLLAIVFVIIPALLVKEKLSQKYSFKLLKQVIENLGPVSELIKAIVSMFPKSNQ